MSELKTVYIDTADHIEVEIVTGPRTMPVDLAFMKNYMKAGDNDDDLITKLIKSATDAVERYTSRAIMPQTLKAKFWGNETWRSIPIIPALEITEVKTVKQDNSETVHAVGEYQTTGGIESLAVFAPSVMTLQNGRSLDRVEVTYKAGYKTSELIPMPILETIWLMVTLSYQSRDLLNNECVTIESNPVLKQKLFNYKKRYL